MDHKRITLSRSINKNYQSIYFCSNDQGRRKKGQKGARVVLASFSSRFKVVKCARLLLCVHVKLKWTAVIIIVLAENRSCNFAADMVMSGDVNAMYIKSINDTHK